MKIIKTTFYWSLSLTWGVLMTLPGAIIALVLVIMGYKPQKFHHNICFEVGENWGGISFGSFFFVSRGSSNSTKFHEASHGIQNIVLGIFFPIVIGIPSLLWAWFIQDFTNNQRKKQGLPLRNYFWFYTEHNAEWIKNKFFY